MCAADYSFPPHLNVSPECQDLVARIFQVDPEQRITIAEIQASKPPDVCHVSAPGMHGWCTPCAAVPCAAWHVCMHVGCPLTALESLSMRCLLALLTHPHTPPWLSALCVFGACAAASLVQAEPAAALEHGPLQCQVRPLSDQGLTQPLSIPTHALKRVLLDPACVRSRGQEPCVRLVLLQKVGALTPTSMHAQLRGGFSGRHPEPAGHHARAGRREAGGRAAQLGSAGPQFRPEPAGRQRGPGPVISWGD